MVRVMRWTLAACMLVSFGVAFLGIAVVIETINRLTPPRGAESKHSIADARHQ
jgi:hypothetical protein